MNKIINFPELGQAVEKDFSVSSFWIINMFTTTEWKSCLWNAGAHHQSKQSSAVHCGDAPDPQLTLLAQGKVLVKSEVLSSCLVPAKLPVATFIFPAFETLTGYLFVFNPEKSSQLPCGPWHGPDSPSISRQPDHPPCSLLQWLLCSSPASRTMWQQHGAFVFPPHLWLLLNPAGNSDRRKWRPPPA